MRPTATALVVLVMVTAGFGAAGPVGRTAAAFTSSAGNSANSLTNLVVVPPTLSAPVSGTSGAVSLSWNASSTAALAPLTYAVLRRPSGGSYTTITASLTSLSFSDTPPADGSYDYVIQAVVSTFTAASASRAGLSDRTPPSMTITCGGTACSAGWYTAAVSVAVTATDAGSGAASVTRSVDGAAGTTTAGSSASFTVSGSGTHAVAYSGTDVSGNVSATTTSTVRIDGTAPTSATSVAAATGPTTGTVSLSWSAASDADSGVAGYNVQYAQAATCGSATYSLTSIVGVVTSATMTGLTSGKNYCFRLVTRDAAGNTSAATATASAKAK